MNTWVVCRARAVLVAALATAGGTAASGDDAPARIDYLTFAQGAVPVHVGGEGATRGAGFEEAVQSVDGDSGGFIVVPKGKATDTTDTEFVYELPAATLFDRFAVPEVHETPSPSQTFTHRVEVLGSGQGPDDGFTLLAQGTLAVHGEKGQETELAVSAQVPVRWVKLRLTGGIDLPNGSGFLEFSEIIGNGTQDSAELVTGFNGVWKQGGNVIALSQDGGVVSGCYYPSGDLKGTVSGSILKASGTDRLSGVPTHFILSLTDDGGLRGVQSANGAPFRLYAVPPAKPGTDAGCQVPETTLGCGSIIQGIGFDYDSATIRPGAEPVLVALFKGLADDPSAAIRIEGHTSSEGADGYNLELSERRAQAVVDDLIGRGINAARLSAVGAGETRPIADNSSESGRSMNRRVEVVCS